METLNLKRSKESKFSRIINDSTHPHILTGDFKEILKVNTEDDRDIACFLVEEGTIVHEEHDNIRVVERGTNRRIVITYTLSEYNIDGSFGRAID